MSIIENYRGIIEEVKSISLAIGRNAEDIKIIAVSKTFPANVAQEAIDQGITLLGENKIQEAKQKRAGLKGDFSLHLVGHLQSNKAREAVRIFDVIHSIDKLSTAARVDEEAKKINKIQKILVQVNTSGEDTKSGVRPEETVDLCSRLLILKNLEVLGLMTIGPLTEDKNKIRTAFRLLGDTVKEVNLRLGINMKELSMGMSSDYRIAVEEGATMLRIGTSIFGLRDYSNGHSPE